MKFIIAEEINTDSNYVKDYDYKNYYGKFDNIENVFADYTGVSYYDGMIRNPKYAKDKYNRIASIEKLSPIEYFKLCAEGFGISVNSLIKQRAYNAEQNGIIKNCIDKHYKLGMPYVCLDGSKNQEGLHRMYVLGELYGWNKKYPVLIIRIDDADKEKEKELLAMQREIQYNIKNAVNKTLRYNLRNWDDFLSQIEWDLEEEFDKQVKFSAYIDKDEKVLTVSVDNIKYEVYCPEEDFPFLYNDGDDTDEDSTDEDTSFEDIDLDDLDWEDLL